MERKIERNRELGSHCREMREKANFKANTFYTEICHKPSENLSSSFLCATKRMLNKSLKMTTTIATINDDDDDDICSKIEQTRSTPH